MTLNRSLEAGVLAEEHYESWDDFVSAQQRTGSIYSTARYLDILCRAAGGSFSVAAIRDGDSFLAGVGLYRHRVDGRNVISPRRLLYYNGAVLRDDLLVLEGDYSTRLRCLDALCTVLAQQPEDSITLYCKDAYQDFRPWIERGWHASPAYTIVVPITDSAQLWKRLDKNARRLIRRAENAGAVVSADNDFDCLYRAHEEVHRRKGAQLYLARDAFRRYVNDLVAADLGVIFSARLASGEPAAAQLALLGRHPWSHTVCAGSFEAHLRTGATYLLRWRTLVDLGERGYVMNDLTNASLGAVTRFKEQFGGILTMDMSLKLDRPRLDRLMARGARWYRAIRQCGPKRLRYP